MRREIERVGTAVIFLAFGAILGSTVKPTKAATTPPACTVTIAPAHAAPDLDESWVIQRLTACDTVCGPVPFEVSGTKDSITCNCGRPPKIRRTR